MQKNKITHLFFDLDRTLWDFETNSETALEILYQEYDLKQFFPNFLLFLKKYKSVNEEMWQQYYKKEITKDDVRLLRFYNTIGAKREMCIELSKRYIDLSVLQTAVFPHTHEVLQTLKERNYSLHIISNGFREVQEKKLKNCQLADFFTTISTSEDAGYHKPHLKAFEFALNQANAQKENSAIIGDDLNTDIQGALNIGLLTVYFNASYSAVPHKADYEIIDLRSLLDIFNP